MVVPCARGNLARLQPHARSFGCSLVLHESGLFAWLVPCALGTGLELKPCTNGVGQMLESCRHVSGQELEMCAYGTDHTMEPSACCNLLLSALQVLGYLHAWAMGCFPMRSARTHLVIGFCLELYGADDVRSVGPNIPLPNSCGALPCGLVMALLPCP